MHLKLNNNLNKNYSRLDLKIMITIPSAIQTPSGDAFADQMPGNCQPTAIPRIKSSDLMPRHRELEIDHGGRIYRLRITQLNKLILTA